MRGIYIAMIIAKLLNIKNEKLFENVVKYVASCQTYEGGISPITNSEAHGGLTYCAVAALCILDSLWAINIDKLLHWLVNK